MEGLTQDLAPGNLLTASPVEGRKPEQVPITRLAWSNLTKTEQVSSLGEGAAGSVKGREQPAV